MKVVLIGTAIALLVASPALAAWRQVATTYEGATFSVDTNRVFINQDNSVNFWMRTKFPYIQLGADKMDTNITVNCISGLFLRTQLIAYRGRKVVAKGQLNETWRYAYEGDGHWSAIAEVCNNYR